MTRFFLIRHGHIDSIGKSLAGRAPGVHLTPLGVEQVARLYNTFLRKQHLDAIYTSPLERARESAELISQLSGARVVVDSAFNEVDFGEWTSRTFQELETTPGWELFNCWRTRITIPGGESILQVQARAVDRLEQLARGHIDASIAIISHGDVIRAALCHYLSIPLDLMIRFEIDPASVSLLEVQYNSARLCYLNCLVR